MTDEKARAAVFHALEDQLAVSEATLARALESAPEAIGEFDDLLWLFSSNPANHGLIRLQIDEAGFLYRLVRSLDHPRVAELGRYKGGATILLAAAGAHVVSIDNDSLEECQASVESRMPGAADRPTRGVFTSDSSGFVAALDSALSRFGLRDSVDLLTGDTRTWNADETFDLLFFDACASYDGIRREFENWWPQLVDNGWVVFRDGRQPLLPDVVRFVSDLKSGRYSPPSTSARARFVEPSSPGAMVAFRKRTDSQSP
jgi:predicted O-methyltransferase YrrM